MLKQSYGNAQPLIAALGTQKAVVGLRGTAPTLEYAPPIHALLAGIAPPLNARSARFRNCLSSHRSGTLDECEALVRAVELAPSLAAACTDLRTDIELPGALRFVNRLLKSVYGALRAIKGLSPTPFNGTATLMGFALALGGNDQRHVLMSLRHHARHHLAELPTPLGFNPHSNRVHNGSYPHQHRAGRDPPARLVEACVATST